MLHSKRLSAGRPAPRQRLPWPALLCGLASQAPGAICGSSPCEGPHQVVMYCPDGFPAMRARGMPCRPIVNKCNRSKPQRPDTSGRIRADCGHPRAGRADARFFRAGSRWQKLKMPSDTTPWAGTLKALAGPEPGEAGDATPQISLAAETCHPGFLASMIRNHPGPARAFPPVHRLHRPLLLAGLNLEKEAIWPVAHFSSS